jgi:hypothetical protein
MGERQQGIRFFLDQCAQYSFLCDSERDADPGIGTGSHYRKNRLVW